LFKAFAQADASTTRRYGGTGLGLVIAQSLVEKMDGSIQLESRRNHGSVFSFSIPLVCCQPSTEAVCREADVARVNMVLPSAPPGAAAGPEVLVVEDVVLNMILARSLLKAVLPGVRITEATDGLQAWQLVQAQRFDLVLMDIQMPEMDGMELATRIRRLEQDSSGHLPLIAVSAGVLPSERQNALAAGIDVFLAKPLKKEKLAEAIGCYIDVNKNYY